MADNTLAAQNETTGQLVRRVMFRGIPDDQVKVALLICDQYGLEPLLKHVAIIGGNAYITRDGLLHVAHQSGQLDGMPETVIGQDDFGMYATCTVYRKDMAHPFT